MREAFVAADVSLESIERLVLVQEDLGPVIVSRGGEPRWVAAPSMHLTLKALGSMDDALIYDVAQTISKLTASLVPFKVSVEGLFAHPTPARPRLLMSRVGAGAELIERLQKVIEAHLYGIGVEHDPRPFSPIIQVGRVRTPSRAVDLSDVMATTATLDLGESYIKNLMLLQTELGPRGPQATVYKRFPLGV